MIWTKEKIETFWAMKDQGFTLDEIAAELGCTKSAVQNKTHELKVKEKARKANAEKAKNKTRTKKENKKMEADVKPVATAAEMDYDSTLKDEFAAKLAEEEAEKTGNFSAEVGKKVEPVAEEHITAEVSPVMRAAIKSASEDSAVDEMVERLDAEEHSSQVRNMVGDHFREVTKKVEPERPAEVGKTITRASILDSAKEIVTGERERQYGTPEDNFGVIARLWSAYTGHEITPVDVAMMMTLLKVARIKTGHYNIDSYIDACGYLACAAEIADVLL